MNKNIKTFLLNGGHWMQHYIPQRNKKDIDHHVEYTRSKE